MKTKKEIKLKDGTVIAAGTVAAVRFVGEGSPLAIVDIGGREFKTAASRLPKWFEEYRMPGQEEIEEWMNDGGCETISGDWTEPDGWGPDGAPSWLLALGMI